MPYVIRNGPLKHMKYVRFVTKIYNHKTLTYFGIFGALSNLDEDNKLKSEDKKTSDNLMKWFSKNLPKPKNLNHNSQEYFGICWFNPNAIDHIEKCNKICKILGKYNIDTDTIYKSQFNNISYWDKYQIVTMDNIDN